MKEEDKEEYPGEFKDNIIKIIVYFQQFFVVFYISFMTTMICIYGYFLDFCSLI